MVKRNNDTSRLCVTFEHPEILQEFNNYFYNKYETVRGYRLQVLEELIQNFNETQSTEYEPEYIKDNQGLQRQVDKLTTDNEHLQKDKDRLVNDTTILQQDNKSKEEEINDLKKQVENYNTLKEDNIRLSEEVKNYHDNIDNLKDTLKKKEDELQQARAEYKSLAETHNTTITNLTNKHETTINKLTEDHKNEKEEMDKERKLLTAYTMKLKDEMTEIKGLNLMERILKRYPDKTPDIKELPITLENNITDERS